MVLLEDGEVITQILRAALALPDEKGLSVFHMDRRQRPSSLRALLERINKLHITRPMKEMIIEEKQLCFGLNNSVFTNAKPSWRAYYRVFKITAVFAVVVSLVVVAVRRGSLSSSERS